MCALPGPCMSSLLTLVCQASREQYCINKAVTSKPSISEECDRLLGGDGLSCSYHSNFNRLLGSSLADKLKVRASACVRVPD